jgi:hypothetical protein
MAHGPDLEVLERRGRRNSDRVWSDRSGNCGCDYTGDHRCRHKAQDHVLDHPIGAQVEAPGLQDMRRVSVVDDFVVTSDKSFQEAGFVRPVAPDCFVVLSDAAGY